MNGHDDRNLNIVWNLDRLLNSRQTDISKSSTIIKGSSRPVKGVKRRKHDSVRVKAEPARGIDPAVVVLDEGSRHVGLSRQGVLRDDLGHEVVEVLL